MGKETFTIGIDYGTNSVRVLVVRCRDGKEFGSAVFNYPSGDQGVLLDPQDFHLARQHPGDYLLGLEKSVKGALAAAAKQAGFSPDRVIGLGVDTTGSSPIPVDRKTAPSHRIPNGGTTCRPVLALEGSHWLAGGCADYGTRREIPSPVHCQVRQYLFLGMVVEQNLALSEGCPEGLRSRLFLGRTGRLDSFRSGRGGRPSAK